MKPSLTASLSPLLSLVIAVTATACASAPEVASVFSAYRMDVRQGNFVTQEMVAQLKPGQTRDQVRFILGSPLVADMFHADRWDYVYRFLPGRGNAQQRTLTVFFQDNKLSRVAGDVVADESGAGEVARPATRMIEIAAPAAPESSPTAEAAKN